MSTTVTVSIGRNVGDEPMSQDRFDSFRDATWTTLEGHGAVIHFVGTGTGYWDGGTEQSITFVASIENVAGLYRALELLAFNFDQDAIALTTGTTSFPGSREA